MSKSCRAHAGPFLLGPFLLGLFFLLGLLDSGRVFTSSAAAQNPATTVREKDSSPQDKGERNTSDSSEDESKRGLIVNDKRAQDGYTLLAPMKSTRTYLIDNEGRKIHTWRSDFWLGCNAYLLPNGDLLRTAGLVGPNGNPVFGVPGGGGRVQRFNWDGDKIWDFKYSSDMYMSHHDVEFMPNGNVLMIVWEKKTKEEAIQAGRDPATLGRDELWPDSIIEIKPVGKTGGEIVWRWNMWDHFIQDFDSTKANYGVVAQHPELVDINFVGMTEGGPNWPHSNGIDYNPDLDQIVLSMRALSEICIIDHSTTTEEASGHTGGRYGKGGDLLYRWGNPQAYRKGTAQNQQLFQQHDPEWIKKGYPGEGMISIFNNGVSRPDGSYSSVDVIRPPIDEKGNYQIEKGKAYGPAKPAWQFVANPRTDFYSFLLGGAERLPNGNTLVVSGSDGILFEVTPEGETVWEFRNPLIGAGMAPGDPEDKSPARAPPAAPIGAKVPFKTSVYAVFDVERYPKDYPAFIGKDLKPGTPLAPLRSPFIRR